MQKDTIMPEKGFKSGFITIIGAPNAGKSTLLNRMLGTKISITSQKRQTTRNRIMGIVHRPKSQMIFLDTPGIHKAQGAFNSRIVDVALGTLDEVDLILMMVDVAHHDPDSEKLLLMKLKDHKRPVILALNKIDLVNKSNLLTLIERWSNTSCFDSIVPISASRGTQVEALMTLMQKRLPEGPRYYPQDHITDMPERFIAAEMIREKAFRLTGQEIPYAVCVTIESFSEKKNGALVKINATIHVERESQKGILIGKKGSKLKSIGQDAREEIERMLGVQVYLNLFVRVQKNWSRDTKALSRFGY